MLESRSRLDGGEKKTEAITVKVPESMLHFLESRTRQKGMESVPEYVRHLIDLDKGKAEHDFSLLADSLGVKVSLGNVDSEVCARSDDAIGDPR